MKSDYISDYLPKAFHYYGMNKIKAGKGYRDGRPVGRIGGPCDECGTPIVAIQMNTSAKGMECTSEKVCPKCGLIHQGAFTVLDRYEVKYKTKEFQSHEDWLNEAKKAETGNYDDVDANCEYSASLNGYRETTEDAVSYGGNWENISKSNINSTDNKYYNASVGRLKNTNESKRQPKSDWNQREYIEIAKDYANELGMQKYQIDNIIYQIKHDKYNLFKMPYKIDDIILALCIKEYTRKMPHIARGRILKKFYKTSRSLKTIYNVIKDNT